MIPAEIKATLEAVIPKCSPAFAAVLREIADRIAVARQREPGEDEPDPKPLWWDR